MKSRAHRCSGKRRKRVLGTRVDGKVIASILAQLGWDQARLKAKANLSLRTVQRLVIGRERFFHSTIKRLENALRKAWEDQKKGEPFPRIRRPDRVDHPVPGMATATEPETAMSRLDSQSNPTELIADANLVPETGPEWKHLCEYSKRLTALTVARLRHKYSSHVYVSRKEAENTFSKFLKAPQNLFLILGESGTGKTNLLCNLAEKTDFPSLFLAGDLSSADSFSIEAELERCFRPILGDRSTADGILSVLNRNAEASGGLFIIYVDALNEFASPLQVLKAIASFAVLSTAAYRRIKLCLICRTSAWASFAQDHMDLLPIQCLYQLPTGGASDPFRDRALPSSVILDNFSAAELVQAVEAYREQWQFTGPLVGELELLCHCPLFLRIAAETWAGKALPEDSHLVALWDAYWGRVVRSGPPGSEDLLAEIASAMAENGTAQMMLARARQMAHFSDAAIRHLVGARVLMQDDRPHERVLLFAHERLLEYAITRNILANKLPVLEDLSAYWQVLCQFEPLWEALFLYVHMLDEATRWPKLRRLALTSSEGLWLTTDLLGAMVPLPDAGWELLGLVLQNFTFGSALLFRDIASQQLGRLTSTLASLIESREGFDKEEAKSIANCLTDLCRHNTGAMPIVEGWLDMGPRLKCVAFLAISHARAHQVECSDWSRVVRIAMESISNPESYVREAAAHIVLRSVETDPENTVSAAFCLAADPEPRIRWYVGICLAGMASRGERVVELVSSLAADEDWRRREVAGHVIGTALQDSQLGEIAALADSLEVDPRNAVRSAILCEAMQRPLRGGEPHPSRYDAARRLILQSSRGSLRRLAHKLTTGVFPGGTDLDFSLSQHSDYKFHEFAGLIWCPGACADEMQAVESFLHDTPVAVRRAFAMRFTWLFGRRHPLVDSRPMLPIARRLLADPDGRVRAFACRAIYGVGWEGSAECIPLLVDRMVADPDGAVCLSAMISLVRLGSLNHADVRKALYDCLPKLRSPHRIVRLGREIAQAAEKDDAAFEYLCGLTETAGQAGCLAAIGAVWTAAQYSDRQRAERFQNSIVRLLARSDNPDAGLVFVLFPHEFAAWSKSIHSWLDQLIELIEAGYSSSNLDVRFSAVMACWRQLASYSDYPKDVPEAILAKATGDEEWQLRFGSALGGGRVLAAGRVRDRSCCALVARLCATLVHDCDGFVRDAAMFSMAQLPEAFRISVIEGAGDPKERSEVTRAVGTYVCANPEETWIALMAQFFFRNVDWAAEKLVREVDVLALDGSHLLTALWRSRPEETEKMAGEWLGRASRGLQMSARRFLRIAKRMKLGRQSMPKNAVPAMLRPRWVWDWGPMLSSRSLD